MSSVLDVVFERFEPSPEFVSVMAGQEPTVVLGLDIGTSGVRAALFYERGDEIDGASARTNRRIATAADMEEIDADDLVEQVGRTIDALFLRSPQSITRVELVAISCFWHSLVGIDSDGRPTTPVLGWAHTQAAKTAAQMRRRFDEREIHLRTGCRFHPSYWPAKILWLEEQTPHAYRKTERWLSFADYLVLRLFGETATSISMASGTGFLNQHSREWDREFIETLHLSIDRFAPIAAPGKTFAGLSYEYALRWPQLHHAYLLPAIGDGAANSIGAGCATRQQMALMIGTSGAMRVLYEGEPPDDLRSELWSYRADRNRVLVGGALSDGGGLYAWVRESFALGDDAQAIEQALGEMEADSHGLTVLPFWAGERSTGWSPSARGAIIGLTMDHRPIQILRAAMEAVAYRFALVTDALDHLAPDASIIASGNALSSSPVWAQIIADVLGRPVLLSASREASTRGAVLLALEATGKIESIQDSEHSVERTFAPDMSRHARYQEGIGRQAKAYDNLIAGTAIM
jgi:gluconokinase